MFTLVIRNTEESTKRTVRSVEVKKEEGKKKEEEGRPISKVSVRVPANGMAVDMGLWVKWVPGGQVGNEFDEDQGRVRDRARRRRKHQREGL